MVLRLYGWDAENLGFKKFMLAAFAVCFPLMALWIEGSEGGLKPSWENWRFVVWGASYILCMSAMMVVLATMKKMIFFVLVLCALVAAAFKWETGWGHQGCRHGSAKFGNYGEVDCSMEYHAPDGGSPIPFIGGLGGSSYVSIGRGMSWEFSNHRDTFEFYFGIFKGPFHEMAKKVPFKVALSYLVGLGFWVHGLILLIGEDGIRIHRKEAWRTPHKRRRL